MTIRHIRIFVAVCTYGSTTAAAKELYMAQPAVSLAITELEAYYGQKLFDRISNRLHITEAGKQFLQFAEYIVSLFDEMEYKLRNWDNAGVLRVGASITTGNCVLPEVIDEYKRLHPNMKIKVLIDNSEQIERYIMSNEIDIGLIEGAVHEDYISGITFMDDSLAFICRTGHSWAGGEISIERLKEEPLIMREAGSAVRQIADSFLNIHELDIEPLWQSTSTQAIVRAVEKGFGVAMLPYRLIKDNLERGEIALFSVKEVSMKRQFMIIHHQNKFLTASAKAFIDLCREMGPSI